MVIMLFNFQLIHMFHVTKSHVYFAVIIYLQCIYFYGQIAKWFSPYGSVDVKAYGQNKALVAASTHSWQVLLCINKSLPT